MLFPRFFHWQAGFLKIPRLCLLSVAVLAVIAGCTPTSIELENDWKWIRESSSEWSLEEGILKLRTQPDRIWAGEGSKNLLITKLPIGERAQAFADVELVNAIGKWEQCGLLVYQDDDHFVKLIVEHIDGPHFVVMAHELGGKRKVVTKTEIPSNRAQLRLEVEGDEVRGYWRLSESEPWQLASATPSPDIETRRFGLFSQDGPRDEKRYALVRQLSWDLVSP